MEGINLINRFAYTDYVLPLIYCVKIAPNVNHISTHFVGPAILVDSRYISCTFRFTNILANIPHITGIFNEIAFH